MWHLIMGNSSSSEGEEDHTNDQSNEKDSKKNLPSVKEPVSEDVFAEKHRIPSPTRESGDGSEKPPIVLGSDNSPESNENKPSVKLIRLPKTNIRLEKLPPIRDDKVDLPKTEPTSPLVQQLPLAKPERTDRLIKRDKEPKFVPYEPYKAAVTSIVSQKKSRRKKKVSSTSSCNDFRLNEENKIVEYETQESGNSQSLSELASDLKDDKDESVVAVTEQTDQSQELLNLKEQLAEMERQLKIQTQINTEVKKLLVASVGEDIEAKVDFLTQDKARLSADIRQYASKISRDFEEKESLFVEANLWKSKFLACSVIVDELAHWKANLVHRSENFEHFTRLIQHEHSVLWDTLSTTKNILTNLRNAFDPLGATTLKDTDSSPAASLLGIADINLKLAEQLRSRLVGESKINVEKGKGTIMQQLQTPAEEGFDQLMLTPVGDWSGDYSEIASSAVSGMAKMHFIKLGDQLTSPIGFKSCTHCHGKVLDV